MRKKPYLVTPRSVDRRVQSRMRMSSRGAGELIDGFAGERKRSDGERERGRE